MPFAAPLAARAVALALSASLALAAGAALAETKPADKSKSEQVAAAKPELVGSYGDWSVFHSQSGKNKVCYTLAQPKSRDPDDLKRDPGYAFISERPGEGVRNEVSLIMGFDVAAPSADASGQRRQQGQEEGQEAPTRRADRRGRRLELRSAAQRRQSVGEERRPGERAGRRNAQGQDARRQGDLQEGNLTTDTYSLSGFAQAIDRALKDCPGD